MDYIVENAAMLGTVFFAVLFFGIVIMTFRPSKKEELNQCANIPLEDNDGRE